MTLNELLFAAHQWSEQHAHLVLAVGVAIPGVGTLLALLGKGGKTDADGRFIASTVMGVAMLAVSLEVVLLVLAHALHGFSPLDANLMLLAAPLLCLAGSVLGIRLVFPLSELGSVRTALDVGTFLAACAFGVWVLSQFRGWGIHFVGSLLQLLVLGLLALFVLRRLFRRAFRPERTPTARSRYELERR